jgi:hypothetical protein
LAVLLTGIGTGVAATALTRLLKMVQHVIEVRRTDGEQAASLAFTEPTW